MSDYLSDYNYSSATDLSDVTVYWKTSTDGDGVDIAILGPTTGYVAIGFTNYTAEMADNEAVIGWYDNGTYSVEPYTMTRHAVSLDTETLVITNVSAVEIDDETAVFFSRTYSTGKYPIDSTGSSPSTIIVAYGSDGSDSLVKHTARSDDYTIIYFVNSTSSSSSETTDDSPTPTPTPSSTDDLSDYVYSVSAELSDLTIYWTAYTTYVDIALRMTTSGYVAVGFTDGDFEMVDSEAVIGWVLDGTASVTAYWLGGKQTSSVTESSDLVIYDTAATEEDGVTTIYFSRLYSTGVYPIENYTAYLIFAYHSSADYLTEHSSESSALITVDFSTGLASEGTTTLSKESIHAILMFIAFGALFPFGAIFARYGRDIKPKGVWFTVHKYTQFIAAIVGFAGFCVALLMVSGNHFHTEYHGQLGLAVVVAVALQILWGVLRPPNPEPGEPKSSIRNIWEFIHLWFGRIIIIAAIVTIFSGIQEYGDEIDDDATTHVLTTAYAILVAVIGFVILIVELRRCISEITDAHDRITDSDLSYQLLSEGGYTQV